MHPSYYKRPLFIALVTYIILLFLLGKCGVFKSVSVRDICLSTPLKEAVIEGSVAGFPRERRGRTEFVLSVKSLNGNPSRGKAFVRLTKGRPVDKYEDMNVSRRPLKWGDGIRVFGSVYLPGGWQIPGNFDWKDFLEKKGIRSEIKASRAEKTADAVSLLRWISAFRKYVLEMFDSAFSSERSAILSGIVLGEKANLSAPLYRAFQDSGGMHLLVASGSNVGFVTLIVYFICAGLGVRRKFSGILALVFSGFYTLCAGADAPLARAYLMSIAGMTGYLMDRESGIFQGLVIACLAILAVNPRALFQPGFQMSFLAASGIVVGLANWKAPQRWGRFFRNVTGLVMVTFFAQSGLYPLMAEYFHRISLISVVSNIILVPLSAVLMGMGFLISMLAVALPWLCRIFVFVTDFLLGAFQFLVEFFAGLPFSAVWASPLGWGACAAYYLMLFILWHFPDRGFRGRIFRPFAAACVLILALSYALPKKGEAVFFAKGQARCVLLKTLENSGLLVNAGIDGTSLAHAVLESRTGGLDAVILSSLEESSWKGIEELSKIIRVKMICLPFGPVDPELGKTLRRLGGRGCVIKQMWAGESVANGKWSIAARWPLYGGGAGPWRKKGYSGQAAGYDGLSWVLSGPGMVIETGAGAFFARVRSGAAGHPSVYTGSRSPAGSRAVEFDIITRRRKIRRISFSKRGGMVRRP